ncbi:hypothetical protein CYJ61_02300 [Gardnerella leopoldii]|uniref:Uncharacterized protein n=1 Tax=Gardnerella vaginalis TaxID=2702 RepID=A0AAP8IUG5_GARVA|nr:hypothetical protein CYJ61_02300 [Gardnerella vaginalis]
MKAHCAFNFEQAQRIEVHSRALCSSKSSTRTQVSCAHVFATQKQCFCLEWLSALNYLFALRSKRKGRLCRSDRL